MYNNEKLTKLQALADLAQRTKTEIGKIDQKVDTLSDKVDALAASSEASSANAAINTLKDAMYQAPTSTQYRTKGNLTATGTGSITDAALGDLLDLDGLTSVTDEDGVEKYEFALNGQVIGKYTNDTQLSELLADINSNSAAGVQVEYSQAAEEFLFTAEEIGSGGKVEFGDGLAAAMFCTFGNAAFADVYGINLADGESKNITFSFSGSDITVNNIKNDDSMEDVAKKLNKIAPNYGYNVSYNEFSGQFVISDGTGEAVDFTVKDGDEELKPYDGKYVSTYTSGQDAIFTAIKVNGKPQTITGKSVDITVPTTEDITDAVAAGVAASSHLKRKKVDSVETIDPTADDADQYIYMVPKTGGRNGDKYDEYMVLDGVLEPVGDWAVDLSGYVTSDSIATDDEVAEMLAGVFGAGEDQA